MPLDPTSLAAAIKTPTKEAYLTLGAVDNAALETFVTALSAAIASAVVAHITANGAVVTACPAGAGTGTIT